MNRNFENTDVLGAFRHPVSADIAEIQALLRQSAESLRQTKDQIDYHMRKPFAVSLIGDFGVRDGQQSN